MISLRTILIATVAVCATRFVSDSNAQGQVIKQILRQMDQDQNGYINPQDEMTPRLATLVRRYGYNPEEYVEIDSLISTIDERNAGRSTPVGLRKVPGFGNGNDGDTIDTPGFGPPVENTELSNEELYATYSESVMEQVEDVMGRYDGDGNQIIDTNEKEGGRWRNPRFDQSDLDGDGGLSRTELAKRYHSRESTAERNNTGENSEEPREEENDDNRRGRRQRDRNSPGSGQDIEERSQRYVDGIFERYDADGDGTIDAEEKRKMRRAPDGADADGDGNLTRDELLEFSRTGRSQSGSRGRGSAERLASGEQNRTRERGSPPFAEYDTNDDGQIQMNEFSDTWDSTIFQQFQSRDLNGDGLITAEEWTGSR